MAAPTTRRAARLCVAWALLALHLGAVVAAQCDSLRSLGLALPEPAEGEPRVLCAHACPGATGWKVLPVLWAPLRVAVNCSYASYTVVTARSSEALVSRETASPVSWCGLANLLKEPRVCRFALSPLWDQYLGVVPAEPAGFLGGPSLTCQVDSTREVSLPAMCLTLVGVLLFFNAANLTMSQSFRLTSGSLMFMSGFAVLLMLLLMRQVPYKRSLAAVVTLSTSSLWALVRWLYGTWLPSLQTLLFSRLAAAYLLATGVLGLGLTYWLDDRDNVKLNTTIRFTLRLLGLGLVYASVADEAVALAAIGGLVFGHWLLAIARRLHQALNWLARALGLTARRGRGKRVSFAPDVALANGAAAAAGSSQARQRRVRRAAAGPGDEVLFSEESEPEPEHAVPRAASDGDASGEEQQPEQPAPGGNVFRHMFAPAAAAAAAAPPAAAALPSAPSFDAWAGPARQPAGGWRESPVRLKGGPPVSPTVLETPEEARRRRHEMQARMHLAMQGGGAGASAHAAAEAGAPPAQTQQPAGDGYRFPSSTPAAPQRPAGSGSPWSVERLAVDVRAREQPAPAAAAAGSQPAAPPHAAAAATAAAGGSVSPLVARGQIINPDTRRAIKIDGPKYEELLALGYVPDWGQGILMPPEGRAAGAVGASPAAQPRWPASVSPAANTRARRPSSRQQQQ